MPVDDDNVLLTTSCRDRSQNIKFEQTLTQYCIQLDAVRLSCMCYTWWCKKMGLSTTVSQNSASYFTR